MMKKCLKCKKNSVTEDRKFCSYKCYWDFKKGKIQLHLNQGGGHHKGHKHTEKTKKIIGEKGIGRIPWNKNKPSLMKGNKHPLWKGGSSLSDRLRSSFRNQEWIRQVFRKSNFKCDDCDRHRVPGDRVILQAHHILPFSYLLDHIRNNFPEKDWYEVALKYEPLWDVKNGKTLCKECHEKTPTFAGKAKGFLIKNFNG